eukprot:1140235-Pelagomonas_calceolata.AAC.1
MFARARPTAKSASIKAFPLNRKTQQAAEQLTSSLSSRSISGFHFLQQTPYHGTHVNPYTIPFPSIYHGTQFQLLRPISSILPAPFLPCSLCPSGKKDWKEQLSYIGNVNTSQPMSTH